MVIQNTEFSVIINQAIKQTISTITSHLLAKVDSR